MPAFGERPGLVRASLMSHDAEREVRTIEKSFREMEAYPEELSALLKEFLGLWRARGTKPEDQLEVRARQAAYFGTLFEDLGGHYALMPTMSADGYQLRFWYEFPGGLGTDHVDSCGRGCLLNIYGDPKLVEKVARAILPSIGMDFDLNSLRATNGARIWWYIRH